MTSRDPYELLELAVAADPLSANTQDQDRAPYWEKDPTSEDVPVCGMANCDSPGIGTATFRLFDSVGSVQEMTIEICERDLWLLTRAGIVGSAHIRGASN